MIGRKVKTIPLSSLNVKLPEVKPERIMVETGPNNKLCRSCKYSVSISSGSQTPACFYVVATYNLRDCPIGLCDKYEKGSRVLDKGFN